MARRPVAFTTAIVVCLAALPFLSPAVASAQANGVTNVNNPTNTDFDTSNSAYAMQGLADKITSAQESISAMVQKLSAENEKLNAAKEELSELKSELEQERSELEQKLEQIKAERAQLKVQLDLAYQACSKSYAEYLKNKLKFPPAVRSKIEKGWKKTLQAYKSAQLSDDD